MSALEQALRQIAAQHGLCNFSVGVSNYPEGDGFHWFFSLGGQWYDEAESQGRGIVQASGATLAEAFADFNRDLAASRGNIPFLECPLPTVGLVA